MGNALFDGGRDAFLNGSVDWVNDTINGVLVDLDDITGTITDASNASPIVITQTAHGFTDGDRVNIHGIVGNTNANGMYRITTIDTDSYSLDGTTGNAAYVSGGQALNLTSVANLSDIAVEARVSISALTTQTTDKGVADADDLTFTTVTGDQVESLILYKDTGVEATSTLLVFIDNATGLPVTPSGGDIDIVWSDGIDKIFRL